MLNLITQIYDKKNETESLFGTFMRLQKNV